MAHAGCHPTKIFDGQWLTRLHAAVPSPMLLSRLVLVSDDNARMKIRTQSLWCIQKLIPTNKKNKYITVWKTRISRCTLCTYKKESHCLKWPSPWWNHVATTNEHKYRMWNWLQLEHNVKSASTQLELNNMKQWRKFLQKCRLPYQLVTQYWYSDIHLRWHFLN